MASKDMYYKILRALRVLRGEKHLKFYIEKTDKKIRHDVMQITSFPADSFYYGIKE